MTLSLISLTSTVWGKERALSFLLTSVFNGLEQPVVGLVFRPGAGGYFTARVVSHTAMSIIPRTRTSITEPPTQSSLVKRTWVGLRAAELSMPSAIIGLSKPSIFITISATRAGHNINCAMASEPIPFSLLTTTLIRRETWLEVA